MQALLIALALAVLAPVLTALTHRWLEGHRRKWARQRLEADPHVNVGAYITRLELQGHPGPLMKSCYINRLEDGWVEIEGPNGGLMSFTCREFEQLHPVFGTPPNRKRQPARSSARGTRGK